MWPKNDGSTYVPSWDDAKMEPPTIEYIREHGVVIMSSGEKGLVEVKHGLMVSFVRVTLNEDGTIKDFAPFRVNKYKREDK